MKNEFDMETRPLEPITIPRCEVILCLPGGWRDAIQEAGLDVAREIVTVVCAGVPGMAEAKPLPCSKFAALWDVYRNFIPSAPGGERVAIPLRCDVVRCVEAVAEGVYETPQAVLLAIIGRLMPSCQNASKGFSALQPAAVLAR
jgi:hypothetical protein